MDWVQIGFVVPVFIVVWGAAAGIALALIRKGIGE